MNQEDFLKKLTEVAEWHRPQTGPSGAVSVNKRAKKQIVEPPKLSVEEIEAMTDQELLDYYDQLTAWRESQPNETIAPEIVKLKPQPSSCEDCGKELCETRRTERKLYESGSRHWREKCINCQCWRHPQTGEFTLKGPEAHRFFTDYYRPKKGVYKSKYQPTPANKPQPRIAKEKTLTKTEMINKILEEGTWHTRETETSIIRVFEQKKS